MAVKCYSKILWLLYREIYIYLHKIYGLALLMCHGTYFGSLQFIDCENLLVQPRAKTPNGMFHHLVISKYFLIIFNFPSIVVVCDING